MAKTLVKEEELTVLDTRENQDCPGCLHSTLTVTGHFSTGKKLPNGYTPAEGELVKNNYMKCSNLTCRFEQWS